MRKILILFVVAGLISCGGKNKTKAGENDAPDIDDFIGYFKEKTLPISINDSLLKAKNADSTRLNDTLVNQFIGDTIFTALYGKQIPKAYAWGRFKNENMETYLLLKTKGAANAFYVLAFTPEKKLASQLLLMADGKKMNQVNKVDIDDRLTFSLLSRYKDLSGTSNEFSQVYAFNNENVFTMIMKNGLQKGEVLPIINPLDTLPAIHKYSGNYGKDSRNFISIRDGKTPKDFIFFMNMDKGEAEDCQAELKGEAVLVTKDSAVYKSKTDPCTIGFKFGAKSISINESTVCGNKRPSDCSFNAFYHLQKPPSPEKKKKEKTGKKN